MNTEQIGWIRKKTYNVCCFHFEVCDGPEVATGLFLEYLARKYYYKIGSFKSGQLWVRSSDKCNFQIRFPVIKNLILWTCLNRFEVAYAHRYIPYRHNYIVQNMNPMGVVSEKHNIINMWLRLFTKKVDTRLLTVQAGTHFHRNRCQSEVEKNWLKRRMFKQKVAFEQETQCEKSGPSHLKSE